MGVIGRPHGVRGRLHVHSYTADPLDLPRYAPLLDERGRRFDLRWTSDGIAELQEIVDGRIVPVRGRAAAEKLVNVRLYAERDRLPPPDADEFYVVDLIGMQAVRPDGTVLGRVEAVHDYGAGASLEVGSLLVPFTKAWVPDVAIDAGRLIVVPPDEVAAEPAHFKANTQRHAGVG
jgi:16S rRNA processing protein RimM